MTLTSPTADATTTASAITLTGTVSDGESGLAVVQCNGADASVTAGVATCTVPLRPGRNAVVLLARDAAGHNTSKGIRVTRTGTGTTLTLTPATRTLLVEEDAALSLLDEYGAAVTTATWTSSDPAAVALSADDPPVLTARAAGTATITATKNGLSATARITTIVGTSLPDGTTRWSVAPSAGGDLAAPLVPTVCPSGPGGSSLSIRTGASDSAGAITLAGSAGATVRYTTDGSEPTARVHHLRGSVLLRRRSGDGQVRMHVEHHHEQFTTRHWCVPSSMACPPGVAGGGAGSESEAVTTGRAHRYGEVNLDRESSGQWLEAPRRPPGTCGQTGNPADQLSPPGGPPAPVMRTC